jgi:tetratricopeptide (TPR) repeat protein
VTDYGAVARNLIVAIGLQLPLGVLPFPDAVVLVESAEELMAMSDEQLVDCLSEAAAFGRSILVDDPVGGFVYPVLVAAAAQMRLQAVSRWRKAGGDPDHSVMDARMSEWLGRTARYKLDEAMAKLSFRHLNVSLEAFIDAEMLARSLPDLDRPRWAELAHALYGQLRVAHLMGETEHVERCQASLASLAEVPEWRPLLDDLLAGLAPLVDERLRVRAEVIRMVERGGALPPSGPFYPSRLIWYAEQVRKGHLGLGKAQRRLVAEQPWLGAREQLYLVPSTVIAPLIAADRQRAEVYARLHRAVILAAPQTPAMPRVHAAMGLAEALLGPEADPGRATEAAELLAEALTGARASGQTDDYLAGQLTHLLGLAQLACREVERAIGTEHDAIRILRPIVTTPTERYTLGVAFGTLATAYEAERSLDQAFAGYHEAFTLFADNGGGPSALRALRDLTRLGARLDRLDEVRYAALAAARQSSGTADAAAAADIYLRLARNSMLTNDLERAYAEVASAEAMVEALLPAEGPPTPETGCLVYEVRLQQGLLGTMVLHVDPDAYEQTRAFLEQARQIAVWLNDDARLFTAWWSLAQVSLVAGRPEAALRLLDTTQLIRDVREDQRWDEVLLRGRILLATGQPEQAREQLRRAAEGFGDRYPARAMTVLQQLGKACEAMGDVPAALDYYARAVAMHETIRAAMTLSESQIGYRANIDSAYRRLVLLHADPPDGDTHPAAAFAWIERSKSAAFLELLGYSDLRPRTAPAETAPLLDEEQRLLEVIEAARQAIATGGDVIQARLATIGAARRLDELWQELSATLPEYSALRTGTTASWDGIKRLLRAEAVTSST